MLAEVFGCHKELRDFESLESERKTMHPTKYSNSIYSSDTGYVWNRILGNRMQIVSCKNVSWAFSITPSIKILFTYHKTFQKLKHIGICAI